VVSSHILELSLSDVAPAAGEQQGEVTARLRGQISVPMLAASSEIARNAIAH
jgi:hypothetical protein